MTPHYTDPLVTLYLGDCLDVMPTLEAESIDSIVTDPPYGISFMGRHWDHGVPGVDFWREMYRALKPGGYLLTFASTRTVHRFGVAIEDAGFEIRDTLMWIYACLSDDTELLTREHGWVRYNRANEGDHAAAFDPATGELRWERIEAVHQYRHTGNLFEIGPSLVTHNHRVILDAATGRVPRLPRLWDELPSTVGMGEARQESVVLEEVQRQAATGGPEIQDRHASRLDRGVVGVVSPEDDGLRESGLEGRRYHVQEAWELLWSAVRPRTGMGSADGSQGRVHHGASAADGDAHGLPAHPDGVREPREPRSDRQPPREPDAVAGQPDPQAIRAREGDHRDGLPPGDTPRLVDYAGVVWCITVPSGAFVARRGGVAFVTGNSGFPKSLDVSKALDKVAGAERAKVPASGGLHKNRNLNDDGWRKIGDDAADMDGPEPITDLARKWEGWGTALKPAHEPIVMARKPLVGTVAANVTRYGTGALNIDGTRIGYQDDADLATTHGKNPGRNGETVTSEVYGADRPQQQVNNAGRWPSNVLLSDPELFDEPNPYVVGSGATAGASGKVEVQTATSGFGGGGGEREFPFYGDSGGYSRFFIIPKADRAERERGLSNAVEREQNGSPVRNARCLRCGKVQFAAADKRCSCAEPNWIASSQRANSHPTVKPIDLMRHLVRLVTPPGGVVLDPFLGSGTTALAASEEGFRCIGIEREAEYLDIAKGRLMATPMGLGLDVPAGQKKPPKTHPDLSKHQPKRRAPSENYTGGWAGTEDEEPAA